MAGRALGARDALGEDHSPDQFMSFPSKRAGPCERGAWDGKTGRGAIVEGLKRARQVASNQPTRECD